MNLLLLNLLRQIFYANLFTPGLPYKLTFALTYRCNLRCELCRIWARPRKEELTLEKVRAILDSFVSLPWLHFTGGEIFLREDIGDILNVAARKKNLTLLTFPTNGILTDKIIDIVTPLAGRLKGTRLIITCSIDGPIRTHDQLKGLEGAYERCIDTFIRLRRIAGVKAYIGITVYKGNCRKLPELFWDLQEKIPGFDLSEIHFNFAERSVFYNMPEEPSGELVNREVYLYIKDLLKTCGLKRRGIKGFLEKKYFGLMDNYLNSGKTPMSCTGLEGSCFIDPYGDLFPCVNYPARIGNLERPEYNLPVFWRSVSEKRKEIRRTVKEKNCPNCWTPCEAYPSILRRVVFQ